MLLWEVEQKLLEGVEDPEKNVKVDSGSMSLDRDGQKNLQCPVKKVGT